MGHVAEMRPLIHPRVIRVMGQNPGLMTLQGTNCYLVHAPSNYTTLALIDTGSPLPLANLFVPNLLETLRELAGRAGSTRTSLITDIILTHHHADHIGGLPTLLSALQEHQPGCLPRIHKYPIPRSSVLAVKDDEMSEGMPEDAFTRSRFGEAIHWVKDGDVIRIGSEDMSGEEGPVTQLEVVHTPGHTPDSISLLLRSSPSTPSVMYPSAPSLPNSNDPILFSGDTILGQSTTIFTDLTAYLSSLARIRALRVGTIFPGHGPEITGVEACEETVQGYISHRMKREEQIVGVLFDAHATASDDAASGMPKGTALPVRQIVQRMYTGPNEGERVWRAAEAPVKAHLDRLERDGRVRRVRPGAVVGERWAEVEVEQEEVWILVLAPSTYSPSLCLFAQSWEGYSNAPPYTSTKAQAVPSSGDEPTSPPSTPRGSSSNFTLDTVVISLSKSIFSPFVAGCVPFGLFLSGFAWSSEEVRWSAGWAGVVCVGHAFAHIGRIYNAGFRFLLYPTKIVWADQIVVITGGASGIGALLAKTIAARGGKVVVLDINRARTLANDIASYVVDISDCDAVHALAERIHQEIGAPTILVNNAGVVSGKLIQDLDERDVRRTFDVNVLSHFWTLKAFLPGMIDRGEGHVVTVGSVLGIVGSAQMIDYCASKAALLNLHESLRFELRNRFDRPLIQTTLVLPGHIHTPLFSSLHLPTSRTFRFLAPSLEPIQVVDAIRSALEDQEGRVIRLPAYTNVARVMGVAVGLIPLWIKDLAQWWSGADVAMVGYGPPRGVEGSE